MFQSLLDDKGLAEVSSVAEEVLDAINKGYYKEATQLWQKAEMVIEKVKGDTPCFALFCGYRTLGCCCQNWGLASVFSWKGLMTASCKILLLGLSIDALALTRSEWCPGLQVQLVLDSVNGFHKKGCIWQS